MYVTNIDEQLQLQLPMGTTATTQARQQQHKGGRKHPEDGLDGLDGHDRHDRHDDRESREAQATSKAPGRVLSWHERERQREKLKKEQEKQKQRNGLQKLINMLNVELDLGNKIIADQEAGNSQLLHHINALKADLATVERDYGYSTRKTFFDHMADLERYLEGRVRKEKARDIKLVSSEDDELLVDKKVWDGHVAFLERPLRKLKEAHEAEFKKELDELEEKKEKRIKDSEARAQRNDVRAEKAKREQLAKQEAEAELTEVSKEVRSLSRRLWYANNKLRYISLTHDKNRLTHLEGLLKEIFGLEDEIKQVELSSQHSERSERDTKYIEDLHNRITKRKAELLKELDKASGSFEEANTYVETQLQEKTRQLSALEEVLPIEFKASLPAEDVHELEKRLEESIGKLEKSLEEKQDRKKELEKMSMSRRRDTEQKGLPYRMYA
jgi:hypothetical protein